jgi:hypothetical protein
MNQLHKEFLELAKHLNNELGIIPVLYGSLGLQMISGLDFSPRDIDVLVPWEFIDAKWDDLRKTVEKLGYELVDLHELKVYSRSLKDGYRSAKNNNKDLLKIQELKKILKIENGL